jgi:non-homologous end joining protein Ku
MRGKAMVALGRLVVSKCERVIALEAYQKGLLGTTLRYPYEVRSAEDYFSAIPDVEAGSRGSLEGSGRKTRGRWKIPQRHSISRAM